MLAVQEGRLLGVCPPQTVLKVAFKVPDIAISGGLS